MLMCSPTRWKRRATTILKLTQLEPENQIHARNYQQVLGKLGTSSGARLISAEEGAVMVDEMEATAPFIDQRYADDVALAVRAALTDAELFISYNMPAKALGPLMSALPLAPRDLRINQRLAALHTRAQRFTEAAVCCRTLESIYHEAGCPDEATRYGELAAKYEERAASTPALSSRAAARVETAVVAEEVQVSEVAEAVALPAPAAAKELATESGPFFHAAATQPETAEFAVQAAPAQEIDLSAEWEEGFTRGSGSQRGEGRSHGPERQRLRQKLPSPKRSKRSAFTWPTAWRRKRRPVSASWNS